MNAKMNDRPTGAAASNRKTLTQEAFAAAVKGSRLSDTSLDVARAVLVDGLKQRDVCDIYGLKEPRVSAIVKTVMDRYAQTALVADRQVEVVRADYDVAVNKVRKLMGDGATIVRPEDGGAYRGKVLVSTEFHVAQELGRGTAMIHKLSALDVVPSVGQIANVRYVAGQGRTVITSDRMVERGR
jgi:predicted XRE-type DNA-binding protein